MEETRTNEQLALACQAGDKQAIAQLWEQTKALICSWCYHYYERGRDRCAACGVELADLQQEGFLALLDAVQAFEPEREYKFTSWLKFMQLSQLLFLIQFLSKKLNKISRVIQF